MSLCKIMKLSRVASTRFIKKSYHWGKHQHMHCLWPRKWQLWALTGNIKVVFMTSIISDIIASVQLRPAAIKDQVGS